jgi:gamma-glutamylcyclotransferase (GGCT)/AIG2-like uncharacterized protein YtfP
MTEPVTRPYFAYGSNMSKQVITSIAPGAEPLGTGRLADHRLAFTRRSIKWSAGAGNIEECPGLWVYGVLYSIPADELPELDRKEGVPKAYKRTDIDVRTDHGLISAMTYSVIKPELEEIRPHPDYFRQILDGAHERKLPEPYLEFLEYAGERFSDGTRNKGLLLTPTEDRQFSAGEPLIRVNPSDSGNLRHGTFGVLIGDDRKALGKVEVTNLVPAGTCQADQALRACIGVGGPFCFGHRVTVLPCAGDLPHRTFIQPRALTLPSHYISRNDGEKNYCVLHPDRIKVLGLQEGEFARLFAVAHPSEKDDDAVDVTALTIRIFSGSATEVERSSKKSPYPDRSEVYLDKDARQQLGFPELDWELTPVLIRPALWRALAARALFYGLTVLLGIGAVFQVLQAFEPHWNSYVDAGVALAISAAITIALSIVDLRSRFRY